MLCAKLNLIDILNIRRRGRKWVCLFLLKSHNEVPRYKSRRNNDYSLRIPPLLIQRDFFTQLTKKRIQFITLLSSL